MIYLERNACWFNGKKDLEQLYSFKNFPVHMIEGAPVSSDVNIDLLLDMEFKISKSSGSVQISKLVPEQVLYQDSHFQTIHSPVWKMHNVELSKEISKVHPTRILEIGGGTGILERTYHEIVAPIDWTIMEPLPTPVEGCRAKFIEGFFPKDIKKLENIGTVDCFVHSNVWEHMYEPVEFLENITGLMKEGDFSIFSIPDFNGQLTNNFTSMMNFEHTFYLGEEYVDMLLTDCGLEILNKKKYGFNHSIFYTTVKKRKTNTLIADRDLQTDMYKKTKKKFTNFFRHHEKLVSRWNQEICKYKDIDSDTRIYLFGAHISSQFYLAYGLDKTAITTILDNNVSKQGKRVGATPWIVSSTDVLRGQSNPIVILANSPYANEIKVNIIDNVNPSVIFLENNIVEQSCAYDTL